jgi:regulator of replication initiation timing
MLEDKTNDTEKLFNENGSLKTEIAFLKERIISFQRANHILEMENAKIKMQLFS